MNGPEFKAWEPLKDEELVGQALRDSKEKTRETIARIGIQTTAMLLRKNADYGSSAFQPPVMLPLMGPEQALLCRMSDKVARIGTLTAGNKAQVAESLEDTIRDLAGYCLLWLAYQETGSTAGKPV